MSKLFKIAAIIALGAISGCQTMDSAKPQMQALKGKPVTDAFAKLGYPDGQMAIAGKKLYIWSNHDSGTYSVPTTSTTTTYVNGQAIYGTTYGSRTESYEYACKLKLIASQDDIIENWEWEGNIGGCEKYAARLTAK